MMRIAPGARIDIHNSGGKKTGETFNKSVVQEYPNKDGRYILSQEMLTPYNAIYIQKSGKKRGGRRTRKIRMKKNRRTRKRGGNGDEEDEYIKEKRASIKYASIVPKKSITLPGPRNISPTSHRPKPFTMEDAMKKISPKNKQGGHHEALLLGALALTKAIKGKSRKKRKKKNRKKGTNKQR